MFWREKKKGKKRAKKDVLRPRGIEPLSPANRVIPFPDRWKAGIMTIIRQTLELMVAMVRFTNI